MRHTHQRSGVKGAGGRLRGRSLRSALGDRSRPSVRSLAAGIASAIVGAIAVLDGSASASGSAHAVLDATTAPVDGTTFRATGFDPSAPRDLVLWRFDGERYLRLAETRSGEAGDFDFGLQPLPLGHADYGVTTLDRSPTPSDLQSIDRRLPAPVVVAHDPGDDDVLRVLTARADGELFLSDATTGRLLARFAVDPTPGRALAIDLATALPRVRPAAIAIEHRLPDGRRSEPEIWVLADDSER